MNSNDRKPVILLCEDETPILRVTQMKFQNAGYEVDCAQDGVEGWEKIQQRIPDILITDCQMPRMDGMELLRKIREYEPTQELPVLLVTAKGLELDEKPIEQFGALAVINKPFSPRDLLATVEAALAKTGAPKPIVPVEV